MMDGWMDECVMNEWTSECVVNGRVHAFEALRGPLRPVRLFIGPQGLMRPIQDAHK